VVSQLTLAGLGMVRLRDGLGEEVGGLLADWAARREVERR
jgi:hypothetical protein